MSLADLSTAQAAVIHVCPSGCTYARIQDAINAATPGDTVAIGPGSYGETLTIAKNITLSGAGASTTTLDANYRGTAITINGGVTAAISGLTITHGSGSNGGGINATSASLTLSNSTLTSNHATNGGALYNSGSALTLSNTNVMTNGATTGAGVYHSGGPLLLDGDAFMFNKATGNGGAVYSANSTVTLTNTTAISDVATNGGGVYSQGDRLAATNSGINCNETSANGAGLYNNGGTMAVTNTQFLNDLTDHGDGTAIYNAGQGASMAVTGDYFYGSLANGNGTIYNTGATLTLSNTTIYSQTAFNGGGIYDVNGAVSITGQGAPLKLLLPCGPRSNDGRTDIARGGLSELLATTGSGAGLYLTGSSTATITSSSITSTIAYLSGGAIYVDRGSAATLVNSLTTGNSATTGSGGAISNRGAVTVVNSTITGSYAATGGAIANDGAYGGAVTIAGSTLMRDQARGRAGGSAYGGGLSNANGGTVWIENSTISNNSAQPSGGGAAAGAGIANTAGVVTLVNTTVASNGGAATTGGGIYGSGQFILKGSIVAGNTATSGHDCAASSVTSAGYNLLGVVDAACGFAAGVGDQTGTASRPLNAKLGPLQGNGGSTSTMALLSGSPAINAIPVSACTDTHGARVATDQRGIARPQGPACDMGAYEAQQ